MSNLLMRFKGAKQLRGLTHTHTHTGADVPSVVTPATQAPFNHPPGGGWFQEGADVHPPTPKVADVPTGKT